MGRLGGILFVVALITAAVTSPSVSWADPVQVRASRGDGYGRLTFRWPQPVGHQASRDGDRLVITFSRPIEADLRPVVRGLGQLIASTEAAPNEATVVFRIKGDFSVRSYDSGASVVVDIVSAAQQPQPQTNAPQAGNVQGQQVATQQGPTVPVRVGAHDTYSRIVFDWPAATAFEVVRDGVNATIKFAKPGRANVAALAGGRTRNISGAETFVDNGNLSVTLKVDATSQIKAFASGPKVVVDVFAPGTQAAAPAVAATPAAAPEPTSIPTPAPTPVAAASAPTPPSAEGEQPPPPAAVPTAPVELAQSAPVSLEPQPAAQAAPQPAAPPVEDTRIETRAQASTIAEGAVALKFSWDEPVGAAVFRRGGDLWVIFDKRAKIDTEALIRDGAGLITSVEQVPSQNGAVLRMTTAESVNPDIKRAGLAWVLEFMSQPLIPSAPLQADSQPDSPLGARLFVAVPEPGNIIAFRDPEAGDNLIAVPVIPLGHGMSREWSYPQLSFLPSKQGVVLKPLSDDLRVRPLRQGIEVTSTGTLQISSVSAEEKANVDLQQQLAASAGMGGLGPVTRVLDLEKWKRPDLLSFTETKQDLQREVAFAKNDRAKKQSHRNLAQFFFANGFEAEALGVLQEMVRSEPDYAKEPEYLVMHGAASWMMGRMEDARTDLFNPNLDPYDEATFWRAAVVAGEGKLADAAYELRKTGSITQPYPKSLKMPTATLVAAAAVELGDVRQATQYLEVLSVDNPTQAQLDQIKYVSGKLKELSGDFDGAIADWEAVMEGRHRPSRAKAAVARTELLLKRNLFTPADAIEEYEKLRFVWRGDNYEFELLRRLGSLYLDQKFYRNGLRTLRQAATYFPNHEESNQVTKQMSDAFNFLYLKDGADILPPVTAIALYDEFRELTPPGALGDEMIRRLADRLVGVDLLDRAADLLEQQVDFRLKGEDKARVGARLALIYLLDRKYEKSLSALDKTEVPAVADALASQRVLLRAQAEIGLDKPQMALELLTQEVSQDAELVRTGVYWRAGDWKNAAKSLAKVVRGLGVKPNKAMNDSQAAAVLSLAIAHTLDGNEVAITRLLESYGPAVAQTSYADAFRLIAEPPETGLVNFRGLEPIVKKVVDFQGFMEVYRQRIADGQLSSLY
ncbi:tetratricopeptide repeat protein [Magnetovibrio sp.]|uniref:tetratricopeptide repeat protein n=1 Tax=Magnetovibrio sp. TaxID=2024836 RepID=UPI002F925C41